MIELEDLRDLYICKKCKHVYMPEMKADPTDYYQKEYPVNDKLCVNCVESEQ